MPLAQAQTADKDELSHSFLLAMRESFNDNTSDNMYKHIRLDLLSFSLSLRVGTELMRISFSPEIFLRSEIHVKITSPNSVKPFELSVFKVEKLVFVRNPVYKKVWLTQHDLKQRQSTLLCFSKMCKFSLPRRLIALDFLTLFQESDA